MSNQQPEIHSGCCCCNCLQADSSPVSGSLPSCCFNFRGDILSAARNSHPGPNETPWEQNSQPRNSLTSSQRHLSMQLLQLPWRCLISSERLPSRLLMKMSGSGLISNQRVHTCYCCNYLGAVLSAARVCRPDCCCSSQRPNCRLLLQLAGNCRISSQIFTLDAAAAITYKQTHHLSVVPFNAAVK